VTVRTLANLSLAVLLSLAACRTGDLLGNLAGNAAGRGRAGDIARAVVVSASDYAAQMNVKFSPEQEYYLGRGVAASLIERYGLDADERRQEYVREIGAAIVTLSGRVRSTHGGYHFAVLNGDKPNGMSGPGGFVFVTRAALDSARGEDEVAGLLAHEIAHVSLQHGEAVIRAGQQWRTQFAGYARLVGSASGQGGREAERMATLFGDTVRGFTVALADQGYGPEMEMAADREGSFILYDVGYDAAGLSDALKALPDRPATAWSNHPASADRVQALAPVVAQWGGPFDGGAGHDARSARFQTVLSK
jgi:predicted Zn-dependent protease